MYRKRIESIQYALQGIIELYRSQPNVRIHLGMALFAVGMGLFLGLSYAEWSILFLTISMVFAMEAANTALEYLTDLVSPQQHPLAGKVKDVAAAAVLFCAIGSILVGLALFGPKLLAWLFP